MSRDPSITNLEPLYGKSSSFPWDVEFHERDADQVAIRPPTSFRQALGEGPIRVGLIEFKIMLFLASWPYHAFTRRQIAEAVSTVDRPVSEPVVDEYIASLREQLGVFHDYVQTVPHVGYRFKA
jgi:DNA-binding response OmpR family regulator